MIVKAILVALSLTRVTSYQPVPGQTKPDCKSRFHCTTAVNDNVTKFGVAVSQDLLRSGKVHYGDALYIEGYGYRIVNDCMGLTRCVAWSGGQCTERVPIVNSVDLLVFTRDEEKAVGVRNKRVWVLQEPESLPGLH